MLLDAATHRGGQPQPGTARSRGRPGLLGTLLVAQLWQHSCWRVQRRSRLSGGRSSACIIDEVQAFLAGLPGSLADALAQARSLGAAFHLAHQYRGPAEHRDDPGGGSMPTRAPRSYFALSRDRCGRSGPAGNAELEAADFQLLAQYQAYATVMHQGRRSGWFSLATRPAPPAVRDPALLYAASHARYGIPAEQTEADLIALTGSQHTELLSTTHEQCSPTTTCRT